MPGCPLDSGINDAAGIGCCGGILLRLAARHLNQLAQLALYCSQLLSLFLLLFLLACHQRLEQNLLCRHLALLACQLGFEYREIAL